MRTTVTLGLLRLAAYAAAGYCTYSFVTHARTMSDHDLLVAIADMAAFTLLYVALK